MTLQPLVYHQSRAWLASFRNAICCHDIPSFLADIRAAHNVKAMRTMADRWRRFALYHAVSKSHTTPTARGLLEASILLEQSRTATGERQAAVKV